MKMLVFVISLGVLYWAMTSYAHVQLAAGDPCAGPANCLVHRTCGGGVRKS